MADEKSQGLSTAEFKLAVQAAVQRAIGARSIGGGSVTAGVRRITDEMTSQLPGVKLTPVVVKGADHVTAGFRMD